MVAGSWQPGQRGAEEGEDWASLAGTLASRSPAAWWSGAPARGLPGPFFALSTGFVVRKAETPRSQPLRVPETINSNNSITQQHCICICCSVPEITLDSSQISQDKDTTVDPRAMLGWS